MTAGKRGEVSVVLAGWCAAAAAALFLGPSGELLSLIPMAVAAGCSLGTFLFPPLILLFSVALLSPEALPWAVLSGGILCSLKGRDISARTAGFISVASVLWFTPLEASIPIAAVSAAGAFFYRRIWLAYAAAALGFFVSIAFTGLPRLPQGEIQTAGSLIDNDRLHYTVPSLYTGSREVQIPAPVEGLWAIQIAIHSGGVRDSLPMTALSLGETMMFLPAGADTFCCTISPGDTLRIRLMRSFRPFNHPVVHIDASGELL